MEWKPIKTEMNFPKMPESMRDVQESITFDFVKHIHDQENAIVKEGLKRKGFEFDNDFELMEFIKEHGHGFQKGNEITYTIKGIPFLFIVRPPFTIQQLVNEKGEISLSSESFKYSYL